MRPLVLVHGWGAGAATWTRQRSSLADEFRVLTPELPGFGDTPSDGRADAAGFSDALRRSLDGLDGVLLVGWSMGGLVVLDYATRHGSSRLGGLVVVDVPLRTHDCAEFGRRAQEWERRWRADRAGVVREVTELAFVDPDAHRADVESLVADALRADSDAAFDAFVNLRGCDFREALGAIGVPVLFLFGGASTSTSAADAELVPFARVFESCGHALMFEDPSGFDDAIRTFARTLP